MNAPPYLIRRLRELGILSPAAEDTLIRDGIVTLADLRLAVAEARPTVTHPAFARAADLLPDGRPPVPLGRAYETLARLIGPVAALRPHVEAVEPSGDVRRIEPLCRDLVAVVRASDPESAIDAISDLPTLTAIVHRTARRLVVVFEGHEIDVRVATRDEHGTALFTTTGPVEHVSEVLGRRQRRLSATETDIYAQAGLSYVIPELRAVPGISSRARAATLPEPIGREHLRGDLHMHTTYSDGQDSPRAMIGAASALGLEYIAISDHSESAAAARTLKPDDIRRQGEEIARLREQFPHMTILHGLEVDILPDGGLDCADAILEQLDIVLASLHDRAGQTGAELTERCIRAIRHPLVNVITHPSNRLVGRHEGYDMDYESIYAAAIETGTALEIDGAPNHLDLDGTRAAAAVAAGVTLTIDSDCHRAIALERQIGFGVGTARRGGVAPRHVLNTQGVDAVRAFVAAKRAR